MATSLLLSNPFAPLSHFPTKQRTFAPKITLPTPKSTPPFLVKNNPYSPQPPRISQKTRAGASEIGETAEEEVVFAGEDSAEFDLGKQKITSWIYFTGVLGVVLFVLDVVWIDNSTGFGKAFVDSVYSVSGSHESGLIPSPVRSKADHPRRKWGIQKKLLSCGMTPRIEPYSGLEILCDLWLLKAEHLNIVLQVAMFILILIFAAVHSGLASFRDKGEKLIGERAFRVLFAGTSLPLAVSTVVYFINHRYDGVQLWQLQSVPGLHEVMWLANFISFFFLYPSTFNLLEVAAVDKPKMHLWETGIMRITRHPQMVGQVIWCLAHTIWIGNSVAVAASIGLIGHHLFGVWNGDRRLAIRYGDAFETVKSRTSVFPFAAILDGRQKLPKDYYKEFVRLPYLTITALTLGAYFAHPLMQAASYRLHW
ncbi:hypothetical protein RHMOL_Rhmol02G0080400 [Rhododendron molle]|uniref:Uncharacterized protein n=1 Tax=Rhododendron molle TaxID=49168 RepID=A0ACC0PP38_RHOML|nr:hypothetical protein RHMOL_Rhmol02G0080400 [Rhododendron molle]